MSSHVNSSDTFQEVHDCFYYRQEWLDLLAKLYGYSIIQLTTTNADGDTTGLLPLCLMQSPLTGRRLVSLPFSDFCPVLAKDEASMNSLIDQALSLAQEKQVRYLELRTGVNGVLSKRPELIEENLYVRWLVPLVADTNRVWSNLRKQVQQKIRKAQKLGVQVRMAQSRKDIAQYYHLHLLTRSKKHGMPSQSRRFFLELWDAFAADGNVQLLLAEYQGNVIASALLLVSGTTVHFAYSASDERYLHLSPNNLLLWEVITWSCTQGYQTLDLGRTAQDNQGLMDFKRGWGASREPLPYYYYPHVTGLASTSENSWKFRLLTECWKHIPLPLAEYLGSHLYKHLG